MKLASILILLSVLVTGFVLSQQQPANQLKILVFGAHPDDPEKTGGTMAKYVQLGHKVRLVSLTNGDAGHQEMGGGVLAQRRYKETQCAGAAIGAEYLVMDNHDGELMPTLENRQEVIRLIREFQPDLVFTPRPDDYHPDHRNTGLLVRDAAYMVTVPNVVAHTPHLRKNPIFIYVSDRFTKPTPFRPDVVVGIDEVIEKKIDMYHCHESQMYEWLPYNRNQLDLVPKTGRREWLGQQLKPQNKREADQYRAKLIELYGQEKGSKIVYAEAFEVSEYGSPLRKEAVKKYFPFF
ncbi:MAG: PIG-L family deacetylase [Acidobacteria bacterium]|nr:MAG: PIG-L family deacetylase [Acidobacteriota bacterium]